MDLQQTLHRPSQQEVALAAPMPVHLAILHKPGMRQSAHACFCPLKYTSKQWHHMRDQTWRALNVLPLLVGPAW